ncbi:hypothetical protein LZ31DRAFT_225224 [Colletotrichum somersetense]|nr:hypothetical protein LZ31DRAFT_225224 [Colletotrichum somersetense]
MFALVFLRFCCFPPTEAIERFGATMSKGESPPPRDFLSAMLHCLPTTLQAHNAVKGCRYILYWTLPSDAILPMLFLKQDHLQSYLETSPTHVLIKVFHCYDIIRAISHCGRVVIFK